MLKHILNICSLFAVSAPLWGQLSVTPGNQPPFDPVKLVSNFMTGAGIHVLDITYSGDSSAVGYFKNGENSIGLDRGLLMTTGRAASSAPQIGADGLGVDFASYPNGGGTIQPLLSAINQGIIYDVATYTIKFQAYNDSIRFQYIFGSEEYPEFACSFYNDIFAFFIEGPGYPEPFNIARIPGTNLPVSINNIHPDNANYPGCFATFDEFYTSNTDALTPPAYDGFLHPFVAEAAVEPCGIYTMTIAIADVGDSAYDSGVFIQANSFGSTPFVAASFGPGANVLPEPATTAPVSITFEQIPADLLPLTIKLEGDAQNGIDYLLIDSVYTISSSDSVLQFTVQPITDSLPEILETVLVSVSGGNCFAKTFELFIADPGVVFKMADTLLLTGGAIELGGSMLSISDSTWTFSNTTNYTIEPTLKAVSSPIITNAIMLKQLDDERIISSVCMNINHSWVGDLEVYLSAPDGKFIELTTKNGANGDHYTNTCFSPAATAPINQGLPFAPATAAPFTGTFQPEGHWSDLLGSPLNGEWKLQVIDLNNGFTGTLDEWSITFDGKKVDDFSYLWSTGATTPSIIAVQPGMYTVTISNTLSSFSKTFTVQPNCGFSNQLYTICPNDSVVVNGIVYNQNNPSGTQIIEISSDCDSLITINLNIITIENTIEASICTGNTYSFGSSLLTENGTYQQVFPSTMGCDSVVTLQLSVDPAIYNEYSGSFCEGETLHYGGLVISEPGIYYQNFETALGCDSIVQFTATMLPMSFDTIRFSIVPGDSVEVAGVALSEAGNYSFLLTNGYGCDSVLLVKISWLSGANELEHKWPVDIQPNPTRDYLDINWAPGTGFESVMVYRANQQLLAKQSINSQNSHLTFDTGNWEPGVYIIQLNHSAGTVVKKVIRI